MYDELNLKTTLSQEEF